MSYCYKYPFTCITCTSCYAVNPLSVSICDAWPTLMGGGSHTYQLVAPTKDGSALGHQPKGTAVLQKQYSLRSEQHSWASLQYLSVCVRTYTQQKHKSTHQKQLKAVGSSHKGAPETSLPIGGSRGGVPGACPPLQS